MAFCGPERPSYHRRKSPDFCRLGRKSPGSCLVSAPFDRLNNSTSARVICSMLRKGATIEAIESVYRDRGADFFRLALARTSDPELARDAVQEGFARAIRAQAGFRGSGSLEAWICRCVLNAAHDSRAPAGEYELHEADDVVWKPETPDAEVRAAVRRRPARQRDALFLRFYLD